jgi:hypothetical protein
MRKILFGAATLTIAVLGTPASADGPPPYPQEGPSYHSYRGDTYEGEVDRYERDCRCGEPRRIVGPPVIVPAPVVVERRVVVTSPVVVARPVVVERRIVAGPPRYAGGCDGIQPWGARGYFRPGCY